MTEPTKKIDRTWLIVAAGFLVFWFGFLLFFGPRSPSNLPVPRLENTDLVHPADYAWRLVDLEGKTVEFSEFKGKPVFLNIWATWCGPCVMEFPTIARLAADAKLADVSFVCVATDESAEPVKRFMKDKAWSMTVLRANEVPPVFSTEGIPATFLIARDGRIAASEMGAAAWDDPSVVAFLAKLAQK